MNAVLPKGWAGEPPISKTRSWRTTVLQDAFMENYRSPRAANGERLFSRTGGRRGAEAEGLGDRGGNDIFTHFVPLAAVALHNTGCPATGLFLLSFVPDAGPSDHVRTELNKT